MRSYDFTAIEAKWQKFWEDNRSFNVTEDPKFPPEKRIYLLDMFPYPSAGGLHVGHPEGYTATDITGRYLRMKGYNVLRPMGYDSFGLPAEQHAIKTGQHPKTSTEANIANFERQIKSLGFIYDWSRKLSTHEPSYYKWTQFIFLQLFKKGLAYEAMMPVNWCEATRAVLANEEVVDGKSVFGGHPVIKRNLRQWVLKITAYADRLSEDLDLCDWPESIKQHQRNWIGRSEGAEITFTEKITGQPIKVYTTRPDTLYGVTFMVLAPALPMVKAITSPAQKAAVEAYVEEALHKSDLERTDLNKEKTGVFTGAYAVNPVNGKEVPIWIGDYVLENYGTGAVMGVPAHDERDHIFAQRFGVPIVAVVAPKGQGSADISEQAFTEEGVSINSEELSGLATAEMKQAVVRKLGSAAEAVVRYKLRDWIFSRQRFWGEPIPIVHCPKCGIVPLPESDLPLLLPEVSSYLPAANGESPLALAEDWVNCACPQCGASAKRETNTMPQWAGSCWYYLRYIDPANSKMFCDPKKEQYWMPVKLYVGGQEHAVLHLLYARFWHKVLYDCGLVSTKEPFRRLVNQGMILGENNEKMSKSRGNVVNPDGVVQEFGADSLRLYEMFMGPLETSKPWNSNGLRGIKKFLDRVWRLYTEHEISNAPPEKALLKLLHKTIKKVENDINTISQYNTAISAMMVLVNELTVMEALPREALETLAKLLCPFAPHLAEELWEMLGHKPLLANEAWPAYDEALCTDDEIEFVLQINGKTRDKMMMAKGLPREQAQELAMAAEALKSRLQGKTIVKVIVIPDRLINVVVKE